MLSREKVERIQMLANNNISVYAIAKECGVSSKTVERYLGITQKEAKPGYMIPYQPTQPMPQRRYNPGEQRIEDEVSEMMNRLDEWGDVYNVPSPSIEERYEEQELCRRFFERLQERERRHHQMMDDLEHSYRMQRYTIRPMAR